jgi:hypothetical protein
MFIKDKEVRKEIDIRPPQDVTASMDGSICGAESEKPQMVGGHEHIVGVRVDTSRYDTPRNITFMIFDSEIE